MGAKTKKHTSVIHPKAATKAASSACQKLTPKQIKFCKAFLANGNNAAQAAITAGYSKKTAYVTACENLRKPNIASYIRQHAEQEQAKFEYTKEKHFKELTELGEQARKCGQLAVAAKTTELKGKLCGLYIEKVEATIKEPRRFVFEIKK